MIVNWHVCLLHKRGETRILMLIIHFRVCRKLEMLSKKKGNKCHARTPLSRRLDSRPTHRTWHRRFLQNRQWYTQAVGMTWTDGFGGRDGNIEHLDFNQVATNIKKTLITGGSWNRLLEKSNINWMGWYQTDFFLENTFPEKKHRWKN